MAAPDADVPKILLCGIPRSGKSSIAKVVFQKMPPHETLFLESTARPDVRTIAHNSLIQFKICDFPGSYYIDDNFLYRFTLTALDEKNLNLYYHSKNLFAGTAFYHDDPSGRAMDQQYFAKCSALVSIIILSCDESERCKKKSLICFAEMI